MQVWPRLQGWMPRPAGGGAALQCCSWCARRLQCRAAARAGTRASHAAAPAPGLGTTHNPWGRNMIYKENGQTNKKET